MIAAQLSLDEARAIILADEALVLSYDQRLTAGRVLGIAVREAWASIVATAQARVAAALDAAATPQG